MNATRIKKDYFFIYFTLPDSGRFINPSQWLSDGPRHKFAKQVSEFSELSEDGKIYFDMTQMGKLFGLDIAIGLLIQIAY